MVDTPETTRILKPGLLWISTIPEGMNPAVIRQIFSKYGDVARIYLEPYSQNSGPSGDAKDLLEGKKKKKSGYNSGRFKEGWIEFESKTVAKNIAESKNMAEIAEKKHGAWSGQFWSLKYSALKKNFNKKRIFSGFAIFSYFSVSFDF